MLRVLWLLFFAQWVANKGSKVWTDCCGPFLFKHVSDDDDWLRRIFLYISVLFIEYRAWLSLFLMLQGRRKEKDEVYWQSWSSSRSLHGCVETGKRSYMITYPASNTLYGNLRRESCVHMPCIKMKIGGVEVDLAFCPWLYLCCATIEVTRFYHQTLLLMYGRSRGQFIVFWWIKNLTRALSCAATNK